MPPLPTDVLLSLEVSLGSFPLSTVLFPWGVGMAKLEAEAEAEAVEVPVILPVAVTVADTALAPALWEATTVVVSCSLPLPAADVDFGLPLMSLPVVDALGIATLEPVTRLEAELVTDEAELVTDEAELVTDEAELVTDETAPPPLLKGAPVGGLPSSVTKN